MDIVSESKTWLNTPYHSGAKIKGVGVDCGQLLIAIYEDAGLLIEGDCEPGYYPADFHLHQSEEKYLGWVEKYCDLITGDPQQGDIALFKFGKCVSHGGICIGNNKIIHSYIGMGVIISNMNEALLCNKSGTSRLYGIYRVRQVT